MIRILDRYLTREFLKLFCLALAILVALSVLVNLFEKLHRYVVWKATALDVIIYYFYTIPREILRMAPLALLIAAFLCVGRLNQNYEFLAMQLARLHPLRAVLPIIILSLAITSGLFVLQEEVASKASEAALRFRHKRIIKDYPTFFRARSQDIWYLAGPNGILHIGLLDTTKGEMQDVSLFQFSPDFSLVQRTDATKAHWRGGGWILTDARIRRFSGGKADVSITEVPEMPLRLTVTPTELSRVEKKVGEMSYRELRRHIRRLTRSGVDARHYVADLVAKPAMLAVNIIMVLLGIVFAFRVGRKGLLLHIGTCIAAAFLYWLSFSVALPLGRNDVLPPLLVVWIPNAIFGSVALLGLLRLRPRI